MAREWWEFIPEDQRSLYQKAGFSRSQRIDGKTALLVIDCTFAFTGSAPVPVKEAIQEFNTACGQPAWATFPAIQKLLGTFRAGQLPIVFTRRDLEAAAAAQGATKSDLVGTLEARRRGQEFPEQIRPREDEWICEKARASAFYGTHLGAYLQVHAVRSVVVCGGTTSGCVRASAVDAFSAGFRVVVAEDACFDRGRYPHLANLFDLHAKYATVLTTDEIVGQLGG